MKRCFVFFGDVDAVIQSFFELHGQDRTAMNLSQSGGQASVVLFARKAEPWQSAEAFRTVLGINKISKGRFLELSDKEATLNLGFEKWMFSEPEPDLMICR